MEISSIECEIEMFLERFKCAQSEYLEQNQVPTDCALDVSSPDMTDVPSLSDVEEENLENCTEVDQSTACPGTLTHTVQAPSELAVASVLSGAKEKDCEYVLSGPQWSKESDCPRIVGCYPRLLADRVCGKQNNRPTLLQLVSQEQSTTSPSSDYVSSTSSFTSVDSSADDTQEFTSLRSSYRSFYGSFGTIWFPTRDYVMGEAGCTLTILDVADLLQTKYAYVSGGKSKSGLPLLTFPDTHHDPELTDTQFISLVNYLTSIPSAHDVENGYSLVIDRRKDKWSAVKSLLNKISENFPCPLQEVAVLKPTGFLQKTFGSLSAGSVKENYKFKLHLLTGTKELREVFDPDQLPSDFGGGLQYDHKIWINERAAVEKFSANTSRIGDTLSGWCKKLQTAEFPNTVDATKLLIEEQEKVHLEIAEDLKTTLSSGEVLLQCFKTISTGDGKEEEVETSALPQYKLVHVTCIERLLQQLDETRQGFTDFWLKHEKKLVQCLQLRQFEDDFRNLHGKVTGHVDMLCKMTDSGDTMQQVHTLLQQLQEFEDSSQRDVEEAENLYTRGTEFTEDNHYAVDCIRPKCLELQRACAQYREVMRQRRDLLKQSEELQQRLDRANSWCNDGISLLANQQLDKFDTSSGARLALSDVDSFLSTSGEFELGDFDDLQNKYEPVLSPVHKVTIEETLKKIGNVHEMCEKRRNSLQRLISKNKKPTVVVQPQQSKIPNSFKPSDNLVKQVPLSSPPLYPSTPANHDADSSQQGHVMRELLETERTYVFELSSVLEGYKDALDKPGLQRLMPAELKGQGSVLFGNLEEIYSFHAGEFIKELEACRDKPSAVGRCFINRKEDFSVYSVYCQNKPASEALICEVGDANPFFKHCQSALGHKLPLSAYLLKPVQRITKYQLLLKELLKTTPDISHQKELQEAISTMVTVLRYVNDVMHASSIIGFPGRFSQQGKLLLQGSFSISYENKKDKTVKDQLSRFKAQQRHVFVYENSVMFCKKREEKSDNSRQGTPRADYLYKSSLEMSTIGLTESVRGDRRKFELWKGQRSEVYTLLAPSVEVKDIWVLEIKRLLLLQFDKIKQQSMRDVPTVPLKRIFKHSPSVSSPPGKGGPAEPAFTVNNNEGEIVQSAAQPVSQGPHNTEICYDDTSWSSSDGFPDFTALENIECGYKYFTVLADYNAMSHTEVTMHESDLVEVIQVGHQGWWLVRHLASELEGWVPASYLEPAKRRSTISSNSGHSSQHSSQSLNNSLSTGSFGKELPQATEV